MNTPLIIIFIVAAMLFITLTVKVHHKRVTWFFGPFILKKSLPISKIESVKQIETKWYYGYGVRHLKKGKLFTVSGFTAVEITKKDGEVVILGTNQPQELIEKIHCAKNETLAGKCLD